MRCLSGQWFPRDSGCCSVGRCSYRSKGSLGGAFCLFRANLLPWLPIRSLTPGADSAILKTRAVSRLHVRVGVLRQGRLERRDIVVDPSGAGRMHPQSTHSSGRKPGSVRNPRWLALSRSRDLFSFMADRPGKMLVSKAAKNQLHLFFSSTPTNEDGRTKE